MSRRIALIFDMDGVIVDSTAIHTEAWRLYLQRRGVTADDIAGRMLGKRNDDIVRDFFGTNLEPSEIAAHGAAKEELYRELMGPELSQRLVPGVVNFIRRSIEHPIGMGTNAEPANVRFILEGAGVLDCFQAIVDGHQAARPKPFPDIYLAVTQRLGLDPAACVVFEDSLSGVDAAIAAGTRVVAVTTSLSHFPRKEVDFSIRDFLDPGLVPWLRAFQNEA